MTKKPKAKTKAKPMADRPLTKKEMESGVWMRGVKELPVEAQAAIKNLGGRPKLADPKQTVTLRLDAEIVRAFRATGAGWQTRINEVLRTHQP